MKANNAAFFFYSITLSIHTEFVNTLIEQYSLSKQAFSSSTVKGPKI